MKPWLSRTLKKGLGLAILAFLFYKIGFSGVISALATANPVYLGLAILMVAVNFPIGALNIHLLLTGSRLKLNFLRVLWYYQISWSHGLFLPSKLGEFSLIYFLKKEGLTYSNGFVIALLDKLITLIVILIVSLVGIWAVFNPSLLIICGIVALMGISVVGMLLIENPPIKWLFGRFRLGRSYNNFQQEFRGYLKRNKSLLVFNILVTVFKWWTMSLTYYFLFLAFGVKVPILIVWVISSLLNVAALIPISLDGLGIREGLAYVLYTNFVNEPSIIGAVLLSHLCIRYLFAGSFTLKWLLKPKRVKP